MTDLFRSLRNALICISDNLSVLFYALFQQLTVTNRIRHFYLQPAKNLGTILLEDSCGTSCSVTTEQSQCIYTKNFFPLPYGAVFHDKITHHKRQVGKLCRVTKNNSILIL